MRMVTTFSGNNRASKVDQRKKKKTPGHSMAHLLISKLNQFPTVED